MKSITFEILVGICCLLGCSPEPRPSPDQKEAALHALAQSGVRIEHKTIDGKKCVKGFDFYNTKAGAPELNYVCMFTEITTLNLACIDIGNADLAKLSGLTNLVELDIQGTRVTDEGFEVISTFRKLKVLDARHISISDRALHYLRDLTELEDLSIGAPTVSDEGLKHLQQLTKLQRLCISGQAITDQGLRAFAGMTNLTAVYIGHCQVTGEGLKHMQSHAIKSLYLQDAKVNKDGVAQVALLPRLAWLCLSHNELSGNALSPLTRQGILPALKYLDVSCSKIGDVELAYLERLTSLESLRLEHTKVSQDAAKVFAARHTLKIIGP